jgi:hypothetical protein
MMLSPVQLCVILETFVEQSVTPGEFMVFLLRNPTLNQQATTSIQDNAESILNCLSQTNEEVTKSWAEHFVTEICAEEITQLTKRQTGLHFLASHATYQQVMDIDIEKLANKMEEKAPTVWHLFDVLLASDRRVTYARKWVHASRCNKLP